MPAHTQREQLIAGLESMDYSRVEDSRSRRYVVFQTPSGEHYYVGKSGALRQGRTIAESHPTGPNMRARIMDQGNRCLTARKLGLAV